MDRKTYERKLRDLVDNAWDQEVQWREVSAWIDNFTGETIDESEEKLYLMFFLTRFVYFSKRLMREMLKALYRDYFVAPICQRIRRNCNDSMDISQIQFLFDQELAATKFIGIGNPSESGAHLLYYFRQVNHLSKEHFSDFHGAFTKRADRSEVDGVSISPKQSNIKRYVMFDDVVGSGTQVTDYLSSDLRKLKNDKQLDIRFISLFATTAGLEKLNKKEMFDGKASCLFELDSSYKAFEKESRYFSNSPDWFDIDILKRIVQEYGERLLPNCDMALGYKDGQLLLGFSHNTPDNTPPIFWYENPRSDWSPVFLRYNKIY